MSSTLRKVLFWMHLGAGATAGIVILIMSVTGVLLTYERQINAAADSGFRSIVPGAGADRRSVESLLATLHEQIPDQPTMLTIRAAPDAPAAVEFGRERVVYLNAYTGAVLGEGSRSTRAFFQVVEQWHRWLAVPGSSRSTGRMITGVANLIFFLLVLSGVYLWWPRKWTRQYLRPATWFRGGLRGKARDWNWHNSIGLWCAAPLLFIVVSGVVMSFPWANSLLYRIAGDEPPTQQGNGERGARREPRPGSADGLNVLWTRAEQQVPGWRSISLRSPTSPGGTASFVIDQGNGGQPDLRSTLTLNRRTAEVVRWEPFNTLSLGRRLRSWVRFGHTGEAAGLAGQTIAGIASAGAAVLVWTGLSLALRRLASSRARRMRTSAVGSPEYLVLGKDT